jgi:hypothetical protein
VILAAYALLATLRDDTPAVLDDVARFLADGKNRTALLSAQATGRHSYRFPLVRRQRMRNGAGKPVTGL